MLNRLSGLVLSRPQQTAVAVAIGLAAAGVAGLWLLPLLRDQAALVIAPTRPSTPVPPAQAAWVSPLQGKCSHFDRILQRRLRHLQGSLRQRTRHLQIDPSNYGERHSVDGYGNRVDTQPSVVVLHETVYGIGSAIHTFTTHHPEDADQVSYHILIGEDGQIVQAVDPSRRAFGAGHSAFRGRWVVLNRDLSGSVNNFALHVSLETPLDGEDDAPEHSGYSSQQYDALAVVLADWIHRYRIPIDHITTHRHVDLGGERADPRSFDWGALQTRLAALGVAC